MARILVVSADISERDTLVQWLVAAGHHASAISDFQHAKKQLDAHPPDVLIASVKLGEYNGLHLAIRARFSSSATPAIVLGPADIVLRAEAERQHAGYVTVPVDRDEIMEGVGTVLTQHRAARRTIRKRILRRVGAYVDGHDATLIEVSYEGLRFELTSIAEPVPTVFTLRVPTFNVACRMQRVWVERPDISGEVWSCGAELATTDASAAVAWRAFVDAVPGCTVVAATN